MWLLHLKVLEVTVLLALEQPTEDASNSRYHLGGRCCQCKFDILHGNVRALYLAEAKNRPATPAVHDKDAEDVAGDLNENTEEGMMSWEEAT